MLTCCLRLNDLRRLQNAIHFQPQRTHPATHDQPLAHCSAVHAVV